jgi:hypothetical protein
MCAYCVGELHFSEDEACKPIRAARAARQFPALFEALAEGRLHLNAMVMLAPYFTPDKVDELIAAATHQSTAAVGQAGGAEKDNARNPWVSGPRTPGPKSCGQAARLRLTSSARRRLAVRARGDFAPRGATSRRAARYGIMRT